MNHINEDSESVKRVLLVASLDWENGLAVQHEVLSWWLHAGKPKMMLETEETTAGTAAMQALARQGVSSMFIPPRQPSRKLERQRIEGLLSTPVDFALIFSTVGDRHVQGWIDRLSLTPFVLLMRAENQAG